MCYVISVDCNCCWREQKGDTSTNNAGLSIRNYSTTSLFAVKLYRTVKLPPPSPTHTINVYNNTNI